MFNSAIPHSPEANEDSIANCLGYLTLFVSLVGTIFDARKFYLFAQCGSIIVQSNIIFDKFFKEPIFTFA